MPEGELDILPFLAGQGWCQGFDLTVDKTVLNQLQQAKHRVSYCRIPRRARGVRAYTSFAPFFGAVPNLSHVYAASGLEASGLTTGPHRT